MHTFRVVLLAVLLFFIFSLPAFAQVNSDLTFPRIVINLPSRTLELYENNSLIKVYPIAIGKPSTPSPLGDFQIVYKEVDPWWFPPRSGTAVPSGPDNPLGYRWMEFAPLYGIHGTNAPWAIGLAVSNGCIRMHEENAEELFEIVSSGTPVRVTYDRVKVRIDAAREVSIGIYPDIYGWHTLSPSEVKNQLAASGFSGYLSDNEIIELINEEADRQIVFAKFGNLRVNGTMLADNVVTYKETLYVPVWPVASALGVAIAWDEQRGLVRAAKREVAAIIIGDRIFITAANSQILFGGRQVWIPEEDGLHIETLAVLLNGRPLSSETQVIDGIVAVPFLLLADSTGQKVMLLADGGYIVQGKKAPIILIGNIPYLQITKINEVFQAHVYWNQPARTIDLTYPFKEKGL